MTVAAVDIGGANLKGARDDGLVTSRAFALWREPGGLAAALGELLAALEPFDRLAVTMTGELCDCYSSKEEGVLHILAAVEEAARTPLQVWLLQDGLCELEKARSDPLRAAAGNWEALATWAAGLKGNEDSLLIDIGSSTTDIIRLEGGSHRATGRSDTERLQLGELVYTGVRRTPVCALLEEIDLAGQPCPLAAELFATTLDAWLLLEEIPEAPDCLSTADGRPATRSMARDRLARMLCLDPQELDQEAALSLARQIALAQENRICRAIGRLLEQDRPAGAFISGEGEFLALRVLQSLGLDDSLITPMSGSCEAAGSGAACAFALARLAAES